MANTKSMKGFIFTLDAMFSLIVAAVGVSILLYVDFTSATAYTISPSQAAGLLQAMLNTNISSGAGGSLYLQYLNASSYASSYTWQQFGHDGALSSSTGFAGEPFLLYTFPTGANYIIPAAAVGDGMAAIDAGNWVFVVNATTGALETTVPKSTFSWAKTVGAPLIYGSSVIFANASGDISSVSVSSKSYNTLWTLPVVAVTPLEIENNYLAFGTPNGFYLVNPLNGSVAASVNLGMQTQMPAYLDGEYVVSTTSLSSQNYLYSYSILGNSLVLTWNVPLMNTQTTQPASTNGTIAVGSGNHIYILSAGGSVVYNGILPSTVRGIGSYGNAYYVETASGIYAISDNGNTLFSAGTLADAQNSTPSAGPSAFYTLINGNVMQGYSPQFQNMLWNITLPSTYLNTGYSDIALAYGNMYVPSGNTLYVFGMYKPLPGESVLQALGNMYLNGQGDYADAVLQDLYNSSNVGIFLNGTYAPSIGAATFNSAANGFVEQANGFGWMNSQFSRFTMSVWVYPTAANGVVIDEQGTSWHSAILGLSNGNAYATLPGLSCINLGAIPLKSWSNIVLAWNANTLTGYVNGAAANSIQGSRSLPASGALYYPLGTGDSSNCGSGAPFSGSMLNYQIYNVSLAASQAGELYHSGAFGEAIFKPHGMLWLPLLGNTNDFSGSDNFGVPHGITYASTPYVPVGLSNAYQVSKASAQMYLTLDGVPSKYNVSVVTWR